MTDTKQTVTRFDVRETEDGDEIRLFNKRVKLIGFAVDDIARDDYAEALPAFIAAKPRSLDEVEEFLTTEAEEEEGDEAEEGEGGSVVPVKYRIRYGVTQRNGDEIAETLSAYVTKPRTNSKNTDGGLDRGLLREVAAKNGLADKLADYEERGLNGGLLRMNIANILRGMERRGEQVVIGGTLFPARDVGKPKRKRTKKAA